MRLTTQDLLSSLSPFHFSICERLLLSSDQICMVGGGVRDILLSYPVDDLDFVVLDEPAIAIPAIKSQLEALPEVISISDTGAFDSYRTHKLFLETGPRKVEIDLVFPRKETYAFPGARPEVLEGTFMEDLLRRDFTINALCLFGSEMGKSGFFIKDMVGGCKDLEDKKLRILYPASFSDDPIRVIRGVRFITRFSLSWERDTEEKARDPRIAEYLGAITIGRRIAEFAKISAEPSPIDILKILDEMSLLQVLVPGIKLPDDPESDFSNMRNSCSRSEEQDCLFFAFVLKNIESGFHETFINNLPMSKPKRKIIKEFAKV